jgi:hypothetical protein
MLCHRHDCKLETQIDHSMTFDESLLEPFVGYVDLGIYEEANDELEKLPNEVKAHPMVLLGRLHLLVEMKRWDDGAIRPKQMSTSRPERMK